MYAGVAVFLLLCIAGLFGSLFLGKKEQAGQVLGVQEAVIQEFPFVELPKIFADSLALGWENYSWDSRVDFSSLASSTSAADRGKSIRVIYDKPNAGFLVSAPHFNTSPFSSIKISIYIPKESGYENDLFLELGDTKGKNYGSQSLNWYIESKVFKPETWYDIVVPLANLNAANVKVGSISLVSAKPAVIYIDNIEFSPESIFFPAWTPSFDLTAARKKAPPIDLPYTSDFYYRKNDWAKNSGEIDIPFSKMRLFTGTSTNYASYTLLGGDLWTDYRYTIYLDWAVGDSINVMGRYSEDGGFFSCSFYDDGANVTLYQSQNGKLVELDSPLNYTKVRTYNWSTTKSLGIEIKGNQIACLKDGEVKVKHQGLPLAPLFGTPALELWSPKNGQSSMMVNKVVVEAI